MVPAHVSNINPDQMLVNSCIKDCFNFTGLTVKLDSLLCYHRLMTHDARGHYTKIKRKLLKYLRGLNSELNLI